MGRICASERKKGGDGELERNGKRGEKGSLIYEPLRAPLILPTSSTTLLGIFFFFSGEISGGMDIEGEGE